jgi:predicted transglutaminase-like cysteine proteinase
MALLQFQSHRSGKWRCVSRMFSCAIATGTIALLPNAALAQSATMVADADCIAPSVDRPIQMASAFAKLEPAAGPLNGSKAAAILGGSISKLEQMRMAQAFGGVQPTASASAISASDSIERCADVTPPMPSSLPILENAILGTLSVAIKHSPFDRDWVAANAKKGGRRTQAVLAATGARRASDQAAQVEAINRWVNRNIEFGEDRDVYGRADYWAPAAETFRRGIGDCEDFAIAKMELLAALGVTRDKMRLVVARDLVRNADHAVLVVTLADSSVMLDNMTDRMLDARLANDYRPIMSFSQNAKWVHGYAVQPTQKVRMASAASLLSPAAPRLPDVLTVTADPEIPVLSIALLSVPLVLPNGLLSRA